MAAEVTFVTKSEFYKVMVPGLRSKAGRPVYIEFDKQRYTTSDEAEIAFLMAIAERYPDSISVAPGAFVCEVCMKACTTQLALDGHMKTHMSDEEKAAEKAAREAAKAAKKAAEEQAAKKEE